MKCHVYRSAVKEGLYVYVAAPKINSGDAEPHTVPDVVPDVVPDAGRTDAELLGSLPEPVRRQLGQATRVMTLELDGARPLGKEDVHTVIANLASQGFHIQMPHDIEPLLTSIAARTQN